MLLFEWDPIKSKTNFKKHNVTFDEASTCFYDYKAYIFFNEKHSDIEHRELLIGYSFQGRLLISSFTNRESKIRIISSRQANKKERRKYEENRK